MMISTTPKPKVSPRTRLLTKGFTALCILTFFLLPSLPATSTTLVQKQSPSLRPSQAKKGTIALRLSGTSKAPGKALSGTSPGTISLRITGRRIVAVMASDQSGLHPSWRALVGTRYHVGSVDGTDVTPELWRKLIFSMRKVNGSVLLIELLRPFWWLKRQRAAIGRSVSLSLDEMGIRGKATLRKIEPCEADSRLLESGQQIVTGKFVHVVKQVLSLTLEGSKKPLRVTPNHRLFAPERQAWVAASELRIGESLLQSNGQRQKLVARKLLRGARKVYNLEIHRDHRYFVAKSRLLAHNSCYGNEKRDILVLGRGNPQELQEAADIVGGRVINRPELVSQPRKLWRNIHQEMRKADEIIQITDNIPSSSVHGRGVGAWARNERRFIDMNEKLANKRTLVQKRDLGL